MDGWMDGWMGWIDWLIDGLIRFLIPSTRPFVFRGWQATTIIIVPGLLFTLSQLLWCDKPSQHLPGKPLPKPMAWLRETTTISLSLNMNFALAAPPWKLTAKAPKNGWLEYYSSFLFGMAHFSGAMLVFKECTRLTHHGCETLRSLKLAPLSDQIFISILAATLITIIEGFRVAVLGWHF